jgi:hypothetical protein
VYIRDDAADAVVASDEKIQAVVQGRAARVFVPGHAAGVAVNACLMFGWMGTLIGAFRLIPVLGENDFGALATFWTIVLRGHRPGRTLMHRFVLGSLVAGLCVLFVGIARSDSIGVGLSGIGLVLMVGAQRVVAGSSYASFAAFFRAKRTYELTENSEHRPRMSHREP